MVFFKVVFFTHKQHLSKDIIETITLDTYDDRSDLQRVIDWRIENLKKEGYEIVELKDVQNISTPIIKVDKK